MLWSRLLATRFILGVAPLLLSRKPNFERLALSAVAPCFNRDTELFWGGLPTTTTALRQSQSPLVKKMRRAVVLRRKKQAFAFQQPIVFPVRVLGAYPARYPLRWESSAPPSTFPSWRTTFPGSFPRREFLRRTPKAERRRGRRAREGARKSWRRRGVDGAC